MPAAAHRSKMSVSGQFDWRPRRWHEAACMRDAHLAQAAKDIDGSDHAPFLDLRPEKIARFLPPCASVGTVSDLKSQKSHARFLNVTVS